MARSEQAPTTFRQEMEAYRQIKEVLGHYDLAVLSLKRCGKSWVAQTEEGMVRVERFNHSMVEFFFVLSALQYFNKRNFCAFPRLILDRDGRPVVQHDGRLFFVVEEPEGAQPNVAEIHVLTGMTRHLAEMHRASVGFSAPAPLQDVRQDWGDWEEKWQFRLDELYRLGEEAQHRRGDFDKAYLKVLDDFLNDGVEGLETLKKLNFREMIEGERLRGGLCHRDFKPENMVERKNSYILTDFDDFAGQSRLEDVARFIAEVGGWDPDRIQYIFDVYNQVYAISPEEREAVLAYLKLPLDLWRVARNYYFRDKPQKRSLRKVAQDMMQRKRCYSRLYENYRNQITPVVNCPWVWGAVETPQGPTYDELWAQLNAGGYISSIGYQPARSPEDLALAVNDQVTVGFTEAIDPNAPPGDSCACGSAASIGVWSGQEVMEQVREEETVGSVAGDSAIIPEEAAPETVSALPDTPGAEPGEIPVPVASPIVAEVQEETADRREEAQAAEVIQVLDTAEPETLAISETSERQETAKAEVEKATLPPENRIIVWKAFPK